MADPRLIPVIVGVGQINDRPADPSVGLDSLGLMETALRRAEEDAGGNWLNRIDRLGIIGQISCPEIEDLPATLARRLGSPDADIAAAAPSGDSPLLLLSEAANAIASGEIEVAAITGGEAIQTAARRAAQRAKDGTATANIARELGKKRRPAHVQKYGLTAPLDIYPLYENASRAAYRQSLAEAQAESGEIWSRFSDVAAANEGAWLRKPVSAREIVETTADNRLLAFPYNKLMVANSSVNQGAGFIVTSLAKAREAGIADARQIHVGRAAAAQEATDFLQRDGYDHSTSMEVSLRQSLAVNGLTIDDIDLVELYSCFPCVPKMARRFLGWPETRPATVAGGLTFCGGPMGNYMSHAVVSMVEALRKGGTGLLFGNGGLATRNHSIVLSSAPIAGGSLPHDFDFHAEADAKRGPIPDFVDGFAGPGAIETYTVFYERDGSARAGVIVGRNQRGERFLAKVAGDDADMIAFLTNGRSEPIGSTGEAVAGPEETMFWRRTGA